MGKSTADPQIEQAGVGALAPLAPLPATLADPKHNGRHTPQMPATFQYTDLPAADVQTLEAQADVVAQVSEQARRMAAEAVLRVGKALSEVHTLLAGRGRDGMFRPWCRDRCGFSHVTAYKSITAFKTFGKCKPGLHLFEVKALYLLSAESCPEDAAKEAIRRAKKGEQITAKVAREIKAKHEPKEDEGKSKKRTMRFGPAADEIRAAVESAWNHLSDTDRQKIPYLLTELAQEYRLSPAASAASAPAPDLGPGPDLGPADPSVASVAFTKTVTDKAITTTSDTLTVIVAGKTYEVQKHRGLWAYRLSPEAGWTVASAEMVQLIEAQLGNTANGNGQVGAVEVGQTGDGQGGADA
ncbi:MAG: hypothetical protein ABSG86_12610 [Thermoguttaceae bacterium]|jgi:hypothetical protein